MEQVLDKITPEVERIGEPYIGARPFSKADVELFFGRDQEATELCDLVAVNSIVILHAQSGAGKSSLLSASVLPRLESKRYHVLGIARVSAGGRSRTNGSNVYAAAALRSIGLEGVGKVEFADAISGRITELATASNNKRKRREDARFVLIIDQFEELFISDPSHWQERIPFLIALTQTAGRNPSLTIVLSLRDEFLANLDPLEKLTGSLSTRRYRLRKLTREAAIRAIERPAELFGVRYEKEALDELLNRLFRLVPSEAGEQERLGEFAEPVQLQVVCQAIWPHRTGNNIALSTVREFGIVETALGGYYDRVISKVIKDSDVREGVLRGWIEKHLITPVRTRALVLKEETSTRGMANSALEALVSEYLLHEERRGQDTWYELAHDRLAIPILEANSRWRTQQGFATLWKELQEKATVWRDSGDSPRGLLRGRQLTNARRFLVRPDVLAFGIPPLIADFFEKSEDAAARRRELKVRSTLVGLLCVAIAAGFAFARIIYQKRMHDKTVELNAFETISKDMARNDEWGPLELLYALQAGLESDDVEPSLRSAAAQRIREALRNYGHAARLRPLDDMPFNVVFDDKDTFAAVLLSGGKGVDLWDLSVGRHIRHIPGDIIGAQFSADSSQIAVTRVRPVASRTTSAILFRDAAINVEPMIFNIQDDKTERELPSLSCTTTRNFFNPSPRPCNALSRDFSWGAVAKEDGTIIVVSLKEADPHTRSFALQAHEERRHIHSIEWASSAPVLLVSAETQFGSTASIGAIVYDAPQDQWQPKYTPKNRATAVSAWVSSLGDGVPFSTSISPDGTILVIAQPLADRGRFQVLCFLVNDGSNRCNSEIELGAASTYEAASAVLIWSNHDTLVTMGSAKTYSWHLPEDHFTEVSNPLPLNSGPLGPNRGVSQQGELGMVSCADQQATAASQQPSSPCTHSVVQIWQPGSQGITTVPVPEYQPGTTAKLSSTLRTLAVYMGSPQNPYVKIYRTGTLPPTAEDDEHSTLQQLIDEACLRLRNMPEFERMNAYGKQCHSAHVHPLASKGAP